MIAIVAQSARHLLARRLAFRAPLSNKLLLRLTSGCRHLSTEVNGGTKSSFDVVVVGGGIVGAAFATSLKMAPMTRDLTVALIDTEPTKSEVVVPSPPEPRVSALSDGGMRLFKSLGAWELMESAAVSPYDAMEVWDFSGMYPLSFAAVDVGRQQLGHIIQNSIMKSALDIRMKEVGVKCYTPMKVKSVNHSLEQEDSVPELELENGEKLRAKLLVGALCTWPAFFDIALNFSPIADGGRSRIRTEVLQSRVFKKDYRQRALVTCVELDRPNTTAWQRFLEGGPIALLPLHEHYSNIVWSMDEEEAQFTNKLDDDVLVERIREAFGQPPHRPMPTIERVVGMRGTFPLQAQQSVRSEEEATTAAATAQYVGNRTALIGDAAHTVHPLAGQGLNLGLRDVVSLASVIAAGRQEGYDIGDETYLKRYEKDAKMRNEKIMGGVDAIKSLFAVDLGPVNTLRNLGMKIVSDVGPIRRYFIEEAAHSSIDLSVFQRPA